MSGNINRKPSNFDWVSVRRNCSIKQMFEELKLGIKQDVETFNSGLKDNPLRVNTFATAENPREIKIFPSDELSEGPTVLVALTGNVIRVSNGETKESFFDISIGLNDEGECMFVVDGKERDSWQVRRRVLEGIFFKA